MAKRTVQRLLALALAGSMSLSVLATAAMAVDYDIAGGTVNVTDDGSGVQSWQGDGEKSSDTTINITNKENITTDQQVVNVGEGVGSDVTINIDNVNADVTDTSAVEANGGTVNITDSTLSGGTEDKAAVEVGGNANVNISGETEIIGSGTGLEVSGEGSVTVESGAQVEIAGNGTTVTGGETDVSGTGLEVNGGTVTVEEGAEVEITGSDVTVKGEGGNATVNASGTGVEVNGGELNVEGKVDTHGAAVSAPKENKTSFTADFTGSTGAAATGGTINVAQNGEVVSSDYTASNKSESYYPYSEDPAGNYIFYKDAYRKITKTDKRNGVLSHKVLISSNPKIEEWVPAEGVPRYTRGKYTTVKMTVDGAGTGLDLSGSAQVKADGSLLATGSGIAMADSVKVSVGPDGRLITNYISKNGGTIDNEGLIFVQNAAEGLREAIDNSGTGLRFVSFEKVPIETSQSGYVTKYSNVLHLYWDVGEDETATELKVPLKEMIIAASDALCSIQKGKLVGTSVLPGDHYNFDIIVTNKSGYTYSYKANSLVVDIGDAVKHAAENGDLYYLNNRVADGAIQALYGVDSSGKVTVEQLLAVEKTLRTTGYKGQTFDSIADYYLYFIEEKTGNRYSSLADVPYADYKYALKYDDLSFQGPTISVTDDEYEALLKHVNEEYPDREYEIYDTGLRDQFGNKKLQIKQTGDVDVQLLYRYNYCFVYGFGGSVTNKDANKWDPPYSTELPNLMEYSTNNQLWQDSNAYFENLANTDLAKTGSMNAQIYLLFDGMLTHNGFQSTGFSLENYIILTRPAEPEKPPVTPEEPGTPPPAGPGTPDNQLRGGYGSFALADNNVSEIIIEDEDVPLADVPKTGDVSMLWLVLSGLCAAAMLLGMKRRRTTQA